MKNVIEKFTRRSKIVELILVTQIGKPDYYQVVVSDVGSQTSIQFDRQNAYKAFDLVKEAMQ